uniref:Putative tetratricopeptide repeat protein n=1 Tax=viral metagenome TaxID=1070528 RepID=A0A6M3LIL4_9ZZZZ
MPRIFIALVLLAILWFQGIKPIVADHYFSKGELGKALEWNPRDSLIQLRAGKIIEVIDTNNGDLTQYSLWHSLGIAMLRQGSVDDAMRAFSKSLYYYPDYEPVKKVISMIERGGKA